MKGHVKKKEESEWIILPLQDLDGQGLRSDL